jgi:hypothetical protein
MSKEEKELAIAKRLESLPLYECGIAAEADYSGAIPEFICSIKNRVSNVTSYILIYHFIHYCSVALESVCLASICMDLSPVGPKERRNHL